MPDRIVTVEAQPGETQRREPRTRMSVVGSIRLPDGTEIPCIVKDISISGAKLGVPGECALPDRFMFKMQNRNLVFAVSLAWRRTVYAGVRIERIARLPKEARTRAF